MDAQLRGSIQTVIADCDVAWNTYKRNAGIAQVEPPPHTPTPQFILLLQRMRGIKKKISGTFTASSPKRTTETRAAAFQPGSLRHVVRCRTRPNWLPLVIRAHFINRQSAIYEESLRRKAWFSARSGGFADALSCRIASEIISQ
jgi:hypothetical protein